MDHKKFKTVSQIQFINSLFAIFRNYSNLIQTKFKLFHNEQKLIERRDRKGVR